MTADTVRTLHEAFAHLPDQSIAVLAANEETVHFDEGEVLFHADGDADAFYFITDGTVSLEIETPGAAPQYVETIGPGQLLGVSWMVPPYQWNWGARARTDVDARRFDAPAVRAAMEEDEELARALLEAVIHEALDRLHGTRIRLMDLYRVAEV